MLTTTIYDLGKVLLQSVPCLLQVEENSAQNSNHELILGETESASLDSNLPTTNVLVGNHFGYPDQASGAGSSSMIAEHENLNVSAIPEPSSIGIVAASLLGGYAIGRYWRSRQKKKDA